MFGNNNTLVCSTCNILALDQNQKETKTSEQCFQLFDSICLGPIYYHLYHIPINVTEPSDGRSILVVNVEKSPDIMWLVNDLKLAMLWII